MASPGLIMTQNNLPAAYDPVGDEIYSLLVDTNGDLKVNVNSVTISGISTLDIEEIGGAAIALGQTTASASLPVVIASDALVGSAHNMWNAASVLANGTSTAIDIKNYSNATVMGHVSAATTITLQLSIDNSTFYDSQVTQILAGAADFALNATIGARYIRLKSSGAATITAVGCAK